MQTKFHDIKNQKMDIRAEIRMLQKRLFYCLNYEIGLLDLLLLLLIFLERVILKCPDSISSVTDHKGADEMFPYSFHYRRGGSVVCV